MIETFTVNNIYKFNKTFFAKSYLIEYGAEFLQRQDAKCVAGNCDDTLGTLFRTWEIKVICLDFIFECLSGQKKQKQDK